MQLKLLAEGRLIESLAQVDAQSVPPGLCLVKPSLLPGPELVVGIHGVVSLHQGGQGHELAAGSLQGKEGIIGLGKGLRLPQGSNASGHFLFHGVHIRTQIRYILKLNHRAPPLKCIAVVKNSHHNFLGGKGQEVEDGAGLCQLQFLLSKSQL